MKKKSVFTRLIGSLKRLRDLYVEPCGFCGRKLGFRPWCNGPYDNLIHKSCCKGQIEELS